MVKDSKYYFGFFAAITLFVSLFLFSRPASASDKEFVINEIHPNPNSGENEWIEFKNFSDNPLDLSQVKIKKSSSETLKNVSDASCDSTDQIYYTCDLGSSWLVNSGSTIIVFLGSIEIDRVSYPSFDSKKGSSFARIPDGKDTDDDIDFSIITASKGLENLLPQYSSLVVINELVPRPWSGTSDEFIELYNSGDALVDIGGWLIDDIADGGSSPFIIPENTLLDAGELMSFYNSDTSILLNDSGDVANLIDPNGEIKSSVSFDQTLRDQSYSKFLNDWKWTLSLTPDAANLLTVEAEDLADEIEIIETDISDARSQPDGTIVSVTGTVIVSPGKLSSQYFYIQTQEAGIQVYSYSKQFPSLSPGDEVRVVGEIGTISKERRIKITKASDISLLSTHPPPEPEKVSFDEVGEDLEGQYVFLTGTISKTSGNTFHIMQGSNEVQVSIRSGTGIKKPKMSVGDKFQIAGILSRYNETYRVLPTKQSDVKLISSSKLADTGPNILIGIISSLFFTAIYGIYKQKSLGYRGDRE